MSSQSLTDLAFEHLKKKKKEMLFAKLWKDVHDKMGMSDEIAKRKIASFYNALMLDSRFISLEGNKWDLRERHSLESLMIDPELLDAIDDGDDYEDYDDVVVEEEN